jgi:hypothetical protein
MTAPLKFLYATAFIALASPALAANPAGTWKSTITAPTAALETTLSLYFESEGNMITGSDTAVSSRRQTPISPGTFKAGKLNFSVKHDMEGQPVTIKYQGTLSGNVITGKATLDFGDRNISADWTAKRERQ